MTSKPKTTKMLEITRVQRRGWPNSLVWRPSWLYASSVKNKTNYARTTPTNSLDEVPRPPAAPRDRPRGFLVLASSADALENCELTVTFEALEKPEILEIVDRGMVVNLTLSTQILN